MKESDLDHLFRELRHSPRPKLGGKFTDDVLLQLQSKAAVLPLRFLAIIAPAVLLLSATIGWSVGGIHDHGEGAAAPPPLIGFGVSEFSTFAQ